MYPSDPISYDKISNYILNLFNNLNGNVKVIHGYIDELLMENNFNKNTDFLKFIFQFRQGSFHSFKCEGYLEYLVVTMYYTPPLLCYTLKEIEILIEHFREAAHWLNSIKSNSYAYKNEDFNKLLSELENQSVILNAISEVKKLYNLSS